MAKNFEVTCPACEALLVIDRLTGELLLHKPRVGRTSESSLEAMVSQLESKKSEAARKFDREMEMQKDRGRLLEERFKEALDRADRSDKPVPNPLDLD
jgi:hypothetical protein